MIALNRIKDIEAKIIEIDPSKFYIVEFDANEITPDQADYIRNQLKEAGVLQGLIVGSQGGKNIKLIDGKVELGDGFRSMRRINARTILVDAHNAIQMAAREFISAHAEIMDQLEIDEQPAGQAEAFSNLFVAIERAYDAAEDPINQDAAKGDQS